MYILVNDDTFIWTITKATLNPQQLVLFIGGNQKKKKKLSVENGARDVFFPLIHSMGVGLLLWSAQLDPVMLMSSPHLKII